jgi:hypothetical protein
MKQKLAFAFLMGIITTCIISFTLVSVNVGYTDAFLKIWLRSWCIAYLVVIPAILFLGPFVQTIVDKLFKKDTPSQSLTDVENNDKPLSGENTSDKE